MKLRQISVFLENRAGRLLRLTEVLADAGVDLRALCVADTQDFGILRCVVSDPEAACAALEAQNIMFSETQVLAVQIEDAPNGLTDVLRILVKEGIAVEYLYSFAGLGTDHAVIIFHVDRIDDALTVLQEQGARLISHYDLAKFSAP